MRETRVRLSASLSSFHPSPSLSQTGPSSLTNASQRSMSVEALGTSPKDIQLHLYQSFLEARTPDVALHVRGTWEGFYKLHRVVLIQAGFFRSLFDGGFREAEHKEAVDVHFDDSNITRAAFEVCISRLYGGGPPLHVDPHLVPTRNVPLTDSFPNPKPPTQTPPGHHPATPRFLLSLLATAIYLSIPTLASQALQLILSSVGPRTVLPYLNFATGKGIPDKQDDELEPAVGLEHLCDAVKGLLSTSSLSSKPSSSKTTETRESLISSELENLHLVHKEGPSDAKDSDHSDNELDEDDEDCGACFSYGPVSDKIGEAAACWLTRWGADMLPYEEEIVEVMQAAGPSTSTTSNCNIPVIWRRGGLTAEWARVVISSDAFFILNERERYNSACRVAEMRRKDGIEKEEEKQWEELFSHGIYYMHMSLDDLIDISRHLSPTTNQPFTPLSIIQSAHWDQSLLKHAITFRPRSTSGSPPHSPSPSKDGELGISLMTAELLASFEPTTPAAAGSTKEEEKRFYPHSDGELGISLMTAELLASFEPTTPAAAGSTKEEEKRFYPVPVDSSLRIGDWDTSGSESRTMEQLFTARTQMTRTGSGRRLQTLARTSECNFFGILNERRTAAECIAFDTSGTARWSPFPPFRFGVEFWGVENSAARLYSQTVWYAGNLFNVYAQVVKKKGQQQLGVYLHRQSSVDPIPCSSTPPSSSAESAERARAQGHGRNLSVPPTSPSQVSIPASVSMLSLIPRPTSRGTTATGNAGPSRSSTPTSTLSTSPPQKSAQPVIHAPIQPYRDPRSSIEAYFTIYCASPTGSSLTRFSSAPDVFCVSQSWGWKSSSLHLQQEDSGAAGNTSVPNFAKEVSVRATGVLGIV